MVDEVQQPVVRPLKVLEDENGRPVRGERFEKPAPRREALSAPIATLVTFTGEADERTEVSVDPASLRRLVEEVGQHGAQLLLRRRVGVGLENSGLCLDHLAQRPVGNPVAVGKRPALTPDDQLGIGVGRPEELPDQPALPDAGDADDRDELRLVLPSGPCERPGEQLELLLSAHELRPAELHDVDTESRSGRDGRPDGHGALLPLREHGLGGLVGDFPLGGPVGRLVDEDRVRRGCRLQPGCRVDDVAGHHSLALCRAGAERHDHLARRHADPNVQIALLQVQLGDRFPDGQRRADRPLGIVLVHHGRAEQGHDGVADELLDRAPVPLELGADERVVVGELSPHILRVEPLCPAREPDQIAEQHGDDLSLLADRLGRAERRAAGIAEARAVRIPVAARRTAHRPVVPHASAQNRAAAVG